jgi:hypothetical protein
VRAISDPKGQAIAIAGFRSSLISPFIGFGSDYYYYCIVFTIEFIALLAHWTQYPSVQLLGSVSLVQAYRITACNASYRLGPSFFNSSAAIESARLPCCFSGISAPLLFPHGSANQCQLHHLSNRLDVLVQNALSISPALGFCWLIVPRSWPDT